MEKLKINFEPFIGTLNIARNLPSDSDLEAAKSIGNQIRQTFQSIGQMVNDPAFAERAAEYFAQRQTNAKAVKAIIDGSNRHSEIERITKTKK